MSAYRMLSDLGYVVGPIARLASPPTSSAPTRRSARRHSCWPRPPRSSAATLQNRTGEDTPAPSEAASANLHLGDGQGAVEGAHHVQAQGSPCGRLERALVRL